MMMNTKIRKKINLRRKVPEPCHSGSLAIMAKDVAEDFVEVAEEEADLKADLGKGFEMEELSEEAFVVCFEEEDLDDRTLTDSNPTTTARKPAHTVDGSVTPSMSVVPAAKNRIRTSSNASQSRGH